MTPHRNPEAGDADSSLRQQVRKPIYGQKAMVVSGHPGASLAGLRVLEAGGNVVDATIAASAALTVLVGHATSVGGDGFLLFHSARDRRTYGLNASGVAPAAATPERFAAGIPLLGPTAALVPGLVRGWARLHERHGRMPWRSLFDDAIAYANDGAVISSVLAERIVAHHEQILADPGSKLTYLHNGAPIALGTRFHQPALAQTLKAIAAEGADEFYCGEMASRTAAYIKERGGLIDRADLENYEPLWVDPAVTTYRGHQVAVMPPNSYGVLLLMQLNGLSALTVDDLRHSVSRRISYQMCAMQKAFQLGIPYICDPDLATGAVDHLLGDGTTEEMRRAVLEHATGAQWKNSGGTSCLLVADAEGNAVNLVQSVFHVFGSQFLDPQTGILFNNRMNGFTAGPDGSTAVHPGRRPPHTLCPVMVSRDDRLRYLLASPGGLSQTLTNVQLINQLIDLGHDIGTAVDAPRWCNTLSGDFIIEPEFPAAVIEQLESFGHRVKRQADPYFYGSAKVIQFLADGVLAGAADRRREAYALGC